METTISFPLKNPSAVVAETTDVKAQAKTRTLKIQPLIRVNRWDSVTVPEIRLSGAWLEKAGFHYGDHVQVKMSDGILVLTPVCNAAAPVY